MLGREIVFGAAAIVCAFTLITAGEAGETESHPVIIVASPSILPEGVKCRIELQPETAESAKSWTVYEGTIKDITKDKVVLTAASIEYRCTSNSPLSYIPFLKRYYKTTGIARSAVEEKEVPVPIDKIRSITLMEAAKPTESAPSVSRPRETDPPRK